MKIFELLKLNDFDDPFFKSQSLDILKNFNRKILEKGLFLHFEPELEVLKTTSFSLYICIRIIHICRRLLALLSASNRKAYLIHNHWLIRNINNYSKYISERDTIFYCKNCGFPSPIFKFTCINCNEIDNEAWDIFHTSLIEAYDLDREEDDESVYEKAAEAILNLSAVITKIPRGKKKSDFCSGCGSPKAKEGDKCKYCGSGYK